jgi:hypothetical protein
MKGGAMKETPMEKSKLRRLQIKYQRTRGGGGFNPPAPTPFYNQSWYF